MGKKLQFTLLYLVVLGFFFIDDIWLAKHKTFGAQSETKTRGEFRYNNDVDDNDDNKS